MAAVRCVSPCSLLPGLFLPKHRPSQAGRAGGRLWAQLAAPRVRVCVSGAQGQALIRAPRGLIFLSPCTGLGG